MPKKNIAFLLSISFTFLFGHLQAQTTTKMTTNNPLLCNPENGVCEIETDQSQQSSTIAEKSTTFPVNIVYFTDPICSSCWGIEPQLRKLKLEYGHLIKITYRMGGLLPDWSYNSGGISQPSHVATHWDEVSPYYDMPIDGDVWLEDPLDSSYPPSIAFKAAQMQSETKAIAFLRILREMVFLQKKNITRWEHLKTAALAAELDVEQFKNDYEGKGKEVFKNDLELARQMGVRGFPTLFLSNANNDHLTLYGFNGYAQFEALIKELWPSAEKRAYDKSPEGLFSIFPTLTTREYVELSEQSKTEALLILENLVKEKRIKRLALKNGDLWTWVD